MSVDKRRSPHVPEGPYELHYSGVHTEWLILGKQEHDGFKVVAWFDKREDAYAAKDFYNGCVVDGKSIPNPTYVFPLLVAFVKEVATFGGQVHFDAGAKRVLDQCGLKVKS